MERQYVAVDLHGRRSMIVRENAAGGELAVVAVGFLIDERAGRSRGQRGAPAAKRGRTTLTAATSGADLKWDSPSTGSAS